MGCTSDIMKCFLNIVNTMSAIVALTLLYFGFTMRNEAPPAYIIFICTIAGVTLVASIVGCCGICRESLCLTLTYAVIVSCLLVGHLIHKVYKVDVSVIKDYAAQSVDRSWQEELVKPGAMDNTQNTYHCCGRYGPSDYSTLSRGYPKTCYRDQVISVSNLYHKGCVLAAQEEFGNLFKWLSSSEWSSVGILAIMVVCAFYLVIRFSKQRRHYHY